MVSYIQNVPFQTEEIAGLLSFRFVMFGSIDSLFGLKREDSPYFPYTILVFLFIM